MCCWVGCDRNSGWAGGVGCPPPALRRFDSLIHQSETCTPEPAIEYQLIVVLFCLSFSLASIQSILLFFFSCCASFFAVVVFVFHVVCCPCCPLLHVPLHAGPRCRRLHHRARRLHDLLRQHQVGCLFCLIRHPTPLMSRRFQTTNTHDSSSSPWGGMPISPAPPNLPWRRVRNFIVPWKSNCPAGSNPCHSHVQFTPLSHFIFLVLLTRTTSKFHSSPPRQRKTKPLPSHLHPILTSSRFHLNFT